MQPPCAWNVLVVEDDWELRTILKAYIEQTYNFRVVEAKSGTAALELARQERPLFVIMDLELPGINGVEATQSLRNDPVTCHIPVLVLSHHGNDKVWQERAWAAGCNQCVDKGIRFEKLNQIIENFAQQALNAELDRCCMARAA